MSLAHPPAFDKLNQYQGDQNWQNFTTLGKINTSLAIA